MSFNQSFGLLVAALLFTQVPSFATLASGSPQLTVQGQATLKKPADSLQLQVGLVSKAETTEEAVQVNANKMEAVLKALKHVGITPSEYQTGSYSIRPLYSKSTPAEIVGYEVTNKISIQTTKLNLIGNLIDAATTSGANSIDNFQFTLDNPRIYRAEAIQAATENAIDDADALAQAAGVAVTRVIAVSLDNAYLSPYQPRMMSLAQTAATIPPIEAGEVSITANVTLTYKISPLKLPD